ncbi:hypothetical protein [Bradyrhizobium sp.]|uniref:hypothetical protein n=1 Tax=Bradyrhizobium sp. TaxID=376 RepID=UPI003C71F8FB
MSKIEVTAAAKAAQSEPGHAPRQQPELSEEDRSKDAFYAQIAEVAEAMIARHGRDFAIGTLVLAAKFVADGKSLANRGNENREAASATKPG